MREQIIESLISHAEGHIAKHKANVEILMQKAVGIGEHGNVLEEIEKELEGKNDLLFTQKMKLLICP